MRPILCLAILLTLVVRAEPPQRARFIPSTPTTATAPATGSGTDTCTGNGCAIGPAGYSTDAGVTLSNTGALVWTNTGGDWKFVPTAISGGSLNLQSASVAYSSWSQSTGRLNNVYGLSVGSAEAGGSWISTGVFNTAGDVQLSTIPTLINAKPTLTGFAGTGASISGSGASVVINVGTGAPGNSGTLTFGTTATTGYNCQCWLEPQVAAVTTESTSDTTTTCVLTNFTIATGAAINWAASSKVHCIIHPY